MASPFKVLITGIDGFTGKYLEIYLQKKGYHVYGTTISIPKVSNHFQCDITDKLSVDRVINDIKPDYIIHLAAISFVGHIDKNAFYNINVIGTENILASLSTNNIKCKKIILTSSAVVYGRQDSYILDENMCPHPINHYGCSKLSMEHISSTYFDKQNIIITRPFNYTGIGQAKEFLIPKIVQHYKEKQPIIKLGNLNVAREFNDINFVINAYHKLMISDYSSTIVNIASQRPIKLLDIIDTMNKIAKYNIKIETDARFVRANDIPSLCGSKQKLVSMIGDITPMPIEELLWTMYEA